MSVQGLLKIEPLIDWLRTKDPNEKYHYSNNTDCLIAQYFKAHGYKDINVGGSDIHINSNRYLIPEAFNDVSGGFHVPVDRRYNERTFGFALKRAEGYKHSG